MTGSPSRAEQRLAEIQNVIDVVLAELDVEDLLEELLDRVRELLDADTAAVLLLDANGTGLVATAAKGIEEEVRQGVRVPLNRGFAGRIAAEKRPVVLDTVDETNVFNPLLIDRGIRSMAGVPLLDAGRVVGVLHVGTLSPRAFTEADLQLLQTVAERVTGATGTRLARVERQAAVALQRGLMPTELPKIPGIALDGRYVPGGGKAVGGDWYDVFLLPTGGLGVVIGDVSGHGLHAAIVMGRVRSALRAYALEHEDPAEVLTKLNAKLLHFEPGEMATVLYARVEPSLDQLTIASAGHPPPVLVTETGSSVVDIRVDPPIGAALRVPRRSITMPFPTSARLCLYTDGLVERRGESIDVGIGRLLDAAAPVRASALTSRVMAALVGSSMLDDDIAVLVVEREPEGDGAPVDLHHRAEPSALADIRRALRRWLQDLNAEGREIDDIVLAVGEATTNAVEHAYGPEGGELRVRLERTGREVRITVADDGAWRAPRGTNRGRGSMIMEACVDSVTVDRGSNGTTITMARRLQGDDGRR